MKSLLTALMCVALLGLSAPAFAFCGFYVAPGDAKLVNNATRVALMRHENRTVMSLQPDYQGPAEEFAMVIPVPEVLKKEEVKTLNRSLFDTLDNYSSPRMAEYWEQDPCPKPVRKYAYPSSAMDEMSMAPRSAAKGSANEKAYVKVEAKFAVGEYDIVILSSNDATALEKWLVDQKYKIPAGAAPYLSPYINSGMYFFVAKVDPKRAKFDGNNAVLSPLRFHFTSNDFALPIRLGMINAGKEQDIVVFVLGESRYVPANYPHAPIPTNFVVKSSVKDNFAGFYEGLYAKARKENEDAIITEYVWELATLQPGGGINQGVKCDPCTGPVSFFTPQWLLELGLDVFGASAGPVLVDDPFGAAPPQPTKRGRTTSVPSKLVLTRLHGRFAPDLANPDIVFEKAEPLRGGMGTPDAKGRLEATQFVEGTNMFQGRYVILNRWDGKIACKNPRRGMWGGPPNGGWPQAQPAGGPRFGGNAPKAANPASYATKKISYAPPKKVKAPVRRGD